MNYPYISFIATSQNEKTIVLTFATKQEALDWYNKLDNHNFCWYKREEIEYVISLKLTDGSFMTIKLLKPIELYRNYIWFLER